MSTIRQIYAFALFVSIALSSCDGVNEKSTSSSAPIKVSVSPVKVTDSRSVERVPGAVRPRLSSQLEAKIPARITKVLVREGDSVKSGDVLIKLDADEIQARFDQAVASKRQADIDLTRFAKLLPAGAATRQEFEQAETKAKLAEGAFLEAKAMLSYSDIVAPYDGVVIRKLAQEGDLASPGKPLLLFESQEQYCFEADIPETISLSMKLGDRFNISISGIAETISGALSEISPTTDSNSRTLRVKIDLPSELKIRTGQFGYVEVPLTHSGQIKVPITSVLKKGQLEIVYVVEGDLALLRLVRTGRATEDSLEVLSGLDDGELLVVSNPSDLIDGSKVEVTR